MKAIIITIIVYSAIVTIANLYKDFSSYTDGIEWTDIVIGGPVFWVTLAFCKFIRPVYTKYKKHKPASEKKYFQKNIEKICKKIINKAINRQKKTPDRIPDYCELPRPNLKNSDGASG